MERKFKRFHHLTYTDRLKIEQMHNGGAGIQEIADALRVNYTTVYRELKRPGVMYEHLNGDYTTDKRYSADIAQQQYEYGKTAKGRPIKLGNDYALADYIERKIADEGRSPAAVLMDIELEGKQFSVRVCEKTIYNYITNGVFLNITNKDLPLHGETKRGYNRVRSASRPPQGESIEHRPEEINQREEPFHWEMDTVQLAVYGSLVQSHRIRDVAHLPAIFVQPCDLHAHLVIHDLVFQFSAQPSHSFRPSEHKKISQVEPFRFFLRYILQVAFAKCNTYRKIFQLKNSQTFTP